MLMLNFLCRNIPTDSHFIQPLGGNFLTVPVRGEHSENDVVSISCYCDTELESVSYWKFVIIQ